MIKITTSKGPIELELNPELAPKSCENFLQYVKSGHYENTIFHRCIPGFMVQGGGMDANMKQKSTSGKIENEADNGLKNDNGTVAMARTNDPHSATSQFFINVNDNEFLNHTAKTPTGWGYCVFAKVTSGMELVMEFSMAPTGNHGGHENVPVDAIIIEKIEILD